MLQFAWIERRLLLPVLRCRTDRRRLSRMTSWLLTGLILALSSLWVYYKKAIGIAAAVVIIASLGSTISKSSLKLATAVPYALYISCAAQSLLMAAGATGTCVMTTVSVACSHIQGTLTVPLAAWNMSKNPAMASALYTTVSACNDYQNVPRYTRLLCRAMASD